MANKRTALLRRVALGEVGALARAITLADSGLSITTSLPDRLEDRAGASVVIGITGPPGVGKSTLINALIAAYRGEGQRVAVLAVDPSSPISGGAVLGDRTRMGDHTDDPGVFIRSVSSRGHLGGLSTSIHQIIDLVELANWDVIVLETVGAGQSEVEVASIADINLVVSAPGLGDEVQAIKAGILEIADILVVNKADAPLAGRLVKQLEMMLSLREVEHQNVAIVRTVATDQDGVSDLLAAIQKIAVVSDRDVRVTRRLEGTRQQHAQYASEVLRYWLLQNEAQSFVEALKPLVSEASTVQELGDALISASIAARRSNH